MAKRKIIFTSVVCFLSTFLAVQSLSETSEPNQSEKTPEARQQDRTTDEEMRRELEQIRRQRRELARQRLMKMTWREIKRDLERWQAERRLERERRLAEMKKRHAEASKSREDIRTTTKELREKTARLRREFLFEKYALRATEEQWKVIKPKLEMLRNRRNRADSTVGLSLTSSSSSRARTANNKRPQVPTFRWKKPWKDKDLDELTEAQKLTKELIALVEKKNTRPEIFRMKMAALRKARSTEAELRRQLSEARRELRQVLTTRQEAVLVLMQWL